MGNKGIVFYVFEDKNFSGSGKDYLSEMESVLKDREMVRLKGIIRKLKGSSENLTWKKLKNQ